MSPTNCCVSSLQPSLGSLPSYLLTLWQPAGAQKTRLVPFYFIILFLFSPSRIVIRKVPFSSPRPKPVSVVLTHLFGGTVLV